MYPIPNSPLPIYIWYQQWHPNLKNPDDEVQIPDRFKLGWVSYPTARGKEKESDIAMAQYYDGLHAKGMEDFIEYQATMGNEITPPMYSNRPIPPYFLRGSNTVIVIAQNPGLTNF